MRTVTHVSGKVGGAPYLRMLLLVLAGSAFVAAAHLAIFFSTGSVAGELVTTLIWGGGMVIGLILPARIYTKWKMAARGLPG